MRCLRADEWQRYFDRDAGREFRVRADAHVASCRECEQQRERIGTMNSTALSLLASLDEGPQQLDVESARLLLRARIAARDRSTNRHWWGIAVAAGIGTVAILGWRTRRHATEQPKSLPSAPVAVATRDEGESTEFLPLGSDGPLQIGIVVRVRLRSQPSASGLIQESVGDDASPREAPHAEVLIGEDGFVHGVRAIR